VLLLLLQLGASRWPLPPRPAQQLLQYSSGTGHVSPGTEQQHSQSVRQRKHHPELPAAAGDASVAAAMPLPMSTRAASATATATVQKVVGWGQQREFSFQAQQQHAGSTGNMSGLTGGSLGLAISGSVMATVGGWIFTEAVDAATAAATAAITGPRNAAADRGPEATQGKPGPAVEPFGAAASPGAAAVEPRCSQQWQVVA